MDELLQKAIERRDVLRRELEAVDMFIHAYVANAEARRVPAKPTNLDLFTPRKSIRSERIMAVQATLAEAERLIIEAGRPLTRAQLLERLERAGHKIVGGDKSKVLGTNLWRSNRFHNLQSAGYWPKSKPIPDQYAHYSIRETMLG